MKTIIHVAHSPDSDDAFMFYALARGKVDTGEYEFVHHLDDIESLNQAAEKGRYEVTALSIHAYAHLADRYALLNSGASMGEGYGPIVVAARPLRELEVRGGRIGVPGLKTSAYLALRLFEGDFHPEVIAFDQIIEAVQAGSIDAGLLIHEGQLSYSDQGLHRVVDLGEWWKRSTGLPLPLGGNAVRRDLGPTRMREISDLIHRSIRYALEHREEALTHALAFGRGLDRARGDRFVGMYVNSRTLDYGEEGRRAVQHFLDRGFEAGVLDRRITVDFF